MTMRPRIKSKRFEKLLAPISKQFPTGDYLIHEGTYDRIREARRSDEPVLHPGAMAQDLKVSEWEQVQTLCEDALKTRSKDLRIAGWLMEAWIELYGFSGAAAGVNLLHGLTQQYWEDLYPKLDPKREASRAGPFRWVNEKLSTKLVTIPLAESNPPLDESFSLGDWRTARWVDRQMINLRGAEREHIEGISSEELLRKALNCSIASVSGSLEDLQLALESTEALSGHLYSLPDTGQISLVQLRRTLQDVRDCAQGLYQEISDTPPPPTEPILKRLMNLGTKRVSTAPQEAPTNDPTTLRPPQSRSEAYQHLREIAEYLMAIEPHSPTPYLILRAVEWGDQTLPEFLNEFKHGLDFEELLKLNPEQ